MLCWIAVINLAVRHFTVCGFRRSRERVYIYICVYICNYVYTHLCHESRSTRHVSCACWICNVYIYMCIIGAAHLMFILYRFYQKFTEFSLFYDERKRLSLEFLYVILNAVVSLNVQFTRREDDFRIL